MRTSSLQLLALTISVVVVGCSGSGTQTLTPPNNAGGTQNSTGGTTSPVGGATSSGGQANGTGGFNSAAGGVSASGGAASGGRTSAGGAGVGGAASGGKAGTGGAGIGGAATGGVVATAGAGPDCAAPMPTGGSNVSISATTTAWVSGSANGLKYGGWTNGSGGTITYFTAAHAFGAAWSSTTSNDFLAHLGLDFSPAKAYPYGTIVAQFAETKTANPTPSYSMIGMYGWMQNPCVEWYVNEDSFGNLQKSSTTVTIDGAAYYLATSTTTGTGGNACESGHTGPWVQMLSHRSSKRQCGTITLSDHFAAWAAQGWKLGGLTSAYINVETGSGTGSIQFPVANVTASN